MTIFNRRVGVAALAACALIVAGCGGSSGGDSSSNSASSGSKPKSGGTSAGANQTITVASGAEAESLDPQKKDDDGNSIVLWRVYESLYDFDVNGELVPLLADGMPKAIDDTTWEVKLRPNVKFSDGQPFDAKSVVSSIERIIDPKYATGFSETATIKGAEAVDDTTVRITTKGPDGLLPNRLAIVKMLPSKLPADFPKTAVGTGPYLLKSYEAGGNAQLVVNPTYWGKKPQITTVNIKNIPDESTRLQALNTGEVDVVPGLSPDQADKAPSSVTSSKAVYVGLLRVNTLKGPLADVKARQALAHSIDRQSIADSLFKGSAIPSSCQPTPVHVGNPDLKEYSFDLNQAKQLVQESGTNGKSVDMTWTTGVFPQDRVVGQAVAQGMSQSGLKVNLKLKGYKAFLTDIYAHGPDAPPLVFTESDNNLGSPASKVGLFYASDGPVSSVNSPEMDALLKDASSKVDPAERDAAYNKVLELGCKDADLITIYERKELYGLAKRIEFAPNPVAYSKMYYDQMKVVTDGN
ncbi:MAG TPA: ABC transporter substrate-binding protein [Conexibacter sp.]